MFPKYSFPFSVPIWQFTGGRTFPLSPSPRRSADLLHRPQEMSETTLIDTGDTHRGPRRSGVDLAIPSSPSSARPTNRRLPSDMKVEASLTNALLRELVHSYERQDKERRKEDLDHYFRTKSADGQEDMKVLLLFSFFP